MGWLVVVYLGSLVLLLLAAFWDTEPFTSEVVQDWNLDNFRQILEQDVYRDVALRTIGMAGFVTIADAVLAFPIAYYMARVARPRTRDLLVVAVLTPLWASYLVKAFAWNADAGRRRLHRLAPEAVRHRLDPATRWGCGSSSRTSGCRS